MRVRLPGLGGRDARGRTRLGWRWQGAALAAGLAALGGARGGLGAGLVALRAGLGAVLRAHGPGGGGRPVLGGPRPVRAGRGLAELCSREAESTLAWPQVYWTALQFKGR